MSRFHRAWAMARPVLLILLCFLCSSCTQLFFYPDRLMRSTPSALGYDYRDIWLRSSDGVRLHAWLIEPPESELVRGSVLFFHGNAENISTHSQAAYWLVDSGFRVLALDYRGYGLSAGKPNVPQVFLDMQAAEEWLRGYLSEQGDESPVVMMGQSLGAALSVYYLAQQEPADRLVHALIVEATFSRWGRIAREVASSHWLTWSFQYPVDWLLTKRYDPLDAVARISPTPLLLIHSVDDNLIDISHQQVLLSAAAQPVQALLTKGAHIMGFANADTRKAVLGFLLDERLSTN